MKKTLLRALTVVLFHATWGNAQAMDLRPDGVSVQGSLGTSGTHMAGAGAGVVWDWEWELLRRKAAITGQTELFVNHWRADAPGGGRDAYTQFGLLPTLRFHLSQGRSPWFIELGIGVTWMDRRFQIPGRSFSTRFNFYDVIGMGYLFGDHRNHELGVRLVHISNAGIKEPNPGQDFVQLRYLSRF